MYRLNRRDGNIQRQTFKDIINEERKEKNLLIVLLDLNLNWNLLFLGQPIYITVTV